jgi:hypothetical protein
MKTIFTILYLIFLARAMFREKWTEAIFWLLIIEFRLLSWYLYDINGYLSLILNKL